MLRTSQSRPCAVYWVLSAAALRLVLTRRVNASPAKGRSGSAARTGIQRTQGPQRGSTAVPRSARGWAALQSQDGCRLDATARTTCQGCQKIQGHDELSTLAAGGRKSAQAGFHSIGTEPEMGGRHNLSALGGRLGAPGWLYLAVIIDMYSRMVIGWAMKEHMMADLVCNALRMVLWQRKQPRGVIVHSGRGSQYCSAAYQALIRAHHLRCSMSAKGNCYDKACAESFFHSLKVGCIHGERFTSRSLMRETVFEYIETDYNRQRRHSTLGYISPEAFEARMSA